MSVFILGMIVGGVIGIVACIATIFIIREFEELN
jgi:hypothetical protein